MGYDTGLSGLNAASEQLSVIGNNVANSNTVGFKASTAQFADVYAASLSGSGSSQIGIGTTIGSIAQQFTQGSLVTDSNSLDMAINGSGFYQMQSSSGALSYTRTGQFQLNNLGQIVNAQGLNLTGYAANAAGKIVTSAPVALQIPTANMPPSATTSATIGLNLNSASTVPATGAFSPTDPTSYNNSTSMAVYDSLGNSHSATYYFSTQGTNPAAWNVYMTLDGTAVPAANTPIGTLNFNSSGTVTSITPNAGAGMSQGTTVDQLSVPITLANGAATPLTINMDFTTTTQYGATFGVNTLNQNGYTSGQLSGFNTNANGIIQGTYTNGQSLNIGQIVLANFANPQGLQNQGGNAWTQTSTSGTALVGAPGSGSLGVIQADATESSNTDLTAELVNMITAQRNYQANAQTIKTEDQDMQTLVNLR